MDFDRQFRLDNFKDIYQRKITQFEIQNKYKLNKTYDRINKKLAEDRRILNWQYEKSSRKTSQLYNYIYKNQISKLCSDVKNFKSVLLPAPIESNIVKIDKPEPARYRFSKYLPRVSSESQDKEPSNKSAFDKIKISHCDFGIKSKNVERLETNDNNECQQELYKKFYNPISHIKHTILRDFIKDLGIKLENEYSLKKITKNNKKRVDILLSDSIGELDVKENRIKYTLDEEINLNLDKHVNFFQKLLRGRAYQTMMILAKNRYEPFLQPFLYPEKTVTEHSSINAEDNEDLKNITRNNILEYTAKRYVSRYINTLSKEAINKLDVEENKRLIKLGELIRVMKEAKESNRRHKEVNGRKEQDEIFKQALKIHQDISEILLEECMEQAIERCAIEEGLQLMHIVTSKRTNFKDEFYYDNNKNIESKLVHNFIIPEANKIIHREQEN